MRLALWMLYIGASYAISTWIARREWLGRPQKVASWRSSIRRHLLELVLHYTRLMPPPAHTPAPAALRAPPAPPSLPGDFQDAAAAIERRLVDVEQYQVPQLAECRGPLSFHNELATAIRQELARARRDLDELKVEADDLDRAKERAAASHLIAAIQQRLDSCTRAYRRAVVASKRQIDASAHLVAREELFASTSGRGSPAPGASDSARAKSPMPGQGGDDALMQATSDVTEGLRRTLQLMQQEVDRSMVSNELLESQTQTMQLTSNQYSTLSSLMNTSKNLITTLERSNILDRLVLFGAFAFFAAVCAHIFKKRVIDRGVHVVGALGGIVAKGGGAVAGLARKASTSDAIADAATQVVKRGAADEWARATAAAVGAAGAVRAGLDMARSKASQVVVDRDVPTQTPSLADPVRNAPAQRDVFEEAVPFEEELSIAPVQPDTHVDSEYGFEETIDSPGETVHVIDDDMSLEGSIPTAADSEPFKPAAVEPLDDYYEDAASDEKDSMASVEEMYDGSEREATSAYDDDDEMEEDDAFPEAHEAETVAPRQPYPPTPSLPDITDLVFETPDAEETPRQEPDIQVAVGDDALSIDKGVAFGDGESATYGSVEEDSADMDEELDDRTEEHDVGADPDHMDGATIEGHILSNAAEVDALWNADDSDELFAVSGTIAGDQLDSVSKFAEPEPVEPLHPLDLDLPTDYSDLDLDAAPGNVWPVEYESDLRAQALDVLETAEEQALPRDVAGVEGTTQPLEVSSEEDAPPPLDVEESGAVPAFETEEFGGQDVAANLPIDLDAEQTIWTDNTAPASLDETLAYSLDDVTATGGVPYDEAEQADESLLEAMLEQQLGHATGPGAFGDRPNFQADERTATGFPSPDQVDEEDDDVPVLSETGRDLPRATEGRDFIDDDEDEHSNFDREYAETEFATEDPTHASTFAPTAEPTEPVTGDSPAETTPPASSYAASTAGRPTAPTDVDVDDLSTSSADSDPSEPAEPAAPIGSPEGAAVSSSPSPLEGYHTDIGAYSSQLSTTELAQTPTPPPKPVDAQQDDALSQRLELNDDLELDPPSTAPLSPTRAESETVEQPTEQVEVPFNQVIEPIADEGESGDVLAMDAAGIRADDAINTPIPVPHATLDSELIDEWEESFGIDLALEDEGKASERYAAEPVEGDVTFTERRRGG